MIHQVRLLSGSPERRDDFESDYFTTTSENDDT
jgi:hypothetical protein